MDSFQKRFDGSVDFFRTWSDYNLNNRSFGNLSEDFWPGLDNPNSTAWLWLVKKSVSYYTLIFGKVLIEKEDI